MTFAAVRRVHHVWVTCMPTGRTGRHTLGRKGMAGLTCMSGFTYIGLLMAVVFVGLGIVGMAQLLAAIGRAEQETELLFIGHQFRQAICSYRLTGPGVGKYPASLDDLLQDPRYPTPRRHLRRLWADPITGFPTWGLVNAPEGGIMGVYSPSDREPKKRVGFDPVDADIAAVAALVASAPVAAASMVATAYRYSDWKFVCRPSG